MRNLVQYANRQSTYVAEYEGGTYLTPDDADWDDIQAIVADLEETLMGNPNTLWGYADRYLRHQSDTSDVDGTFIINLPKPTAGTIHRLDGFAVYRDTNPGSFARVQINIPGGPEVVEDVMVPTVGLFTPGSVRFIVTDADNIRIAFAGSTIGEVVEANAWGYVMVVPT